MKKILYILLAVGAMSAASSCKKCGYCQYPDGSKDEVVCKDNSLGGLLDTYKQTQAQCDADGGKWVNSK